MNLTDAKILTCDLIKKHGLEGWDFAWMRSRRVFGRCNEAYKTISLSKQLVEINEQEEVINTILHEIAHALAGCENKHNNIWKIKCIEIGCRPERCYSSDQVVMPKSRYSYVCPSCGYTVNRYKAPSRIMSCGKCCNAYSNGKFDIRFQLKPTIVKDCQE